MNNQEIFNKVWNGFKNQNWKRSTDGYKCFYREESGLKCAIGHLIPDEEYTPRMEGESIWAVLQSNLLSNELQKELWNCVEFLDRLQAAHDSYSCDGGLEREMRNLAKNYNLTIPED